MEAPAITRRRKPFLAPIILGFGLAVAVVALVSAFIGYAESGASVTIVLRHAEAPGTIADPPLSEAGELRAQGLVRMFGEAGAVGHVTAVFANESRRAQQTVAPLAARLGMPVTIVRSGNLDTLLQRLRHRDNQGTALVVAQRDAVPRIVAALANTPIPELAEADYGTIYVVSVPRFGTASVVSLSY